MITELSTKSFLTFATRFLTDTGSSYKLVIEKGKTKEKMRYDRPALSYINGIFIFQQEVLPSI